MNSLAESKRSTSGFWLTNRCNENANRRVDLCLWTLDSTPDWMLFRQARSLVSEMNAIISNGISSPWSRSSPKPTLFPDDPQMNGQRRKATWGTRMRPWDPLWSHKDPGFLLVCERRQPGAAGVCRKFPDWNRNGEKDWHLWDIMRTCIRHQEPSKALIQVWKEVLRETIHDVIGIACTWRPYTPPSPTIDCSILSSLFFSVIQNFAEVSCVIPRNTSPFSWTCPLRLHSICIIVNNTKESWFCAQQWRLVCMCGTVSLAIIHRTHELPPDQSHEPQN